MSRKRGKLRVFVDSSVLFAVVLSPTVREALAEKYPGNLEALHALLFHFTPRTLSEPSVRSVERCLAFLPLGDAPIIAAAIKAKVGALVTLDQKHFLRNEKLAALKPPFFIMAPGDFIKKYFI